MIKEKAYAKINLFLNVINKRNDGYHDLEMVMASIDLYDILTFKKMNIQDIVVASNVQITVNQEDNLVYKIAKHLQNKYQINEGVEIYIEKKIPIAAGLAGGSADAAATLRGLNRLWKLGLSLKEMAKIGEEFGSDIPFCVYNKLCVARGRGEELMFFDKKINCPILLLNPNIKVSTKDVFERVNPNVLEPRKISDMAAGIYNSNIELIIRELYNALEPVTFELEPTIEMIKQKIQELGIEGVLMSGSGATIFAMSKDKNKLKNIHDIFNDKYYKKLTKIR